MVSKKNPASFGETGLYVLFTTYQPHPFGRMTIIMRIIMTLIRSTLCRRISWLNSAMFKILLIPYYRFLLFVSNQMFKKKAFAEIRKALLFLKNYMHHPDCDCKTTIIPMIIIICKFRFIISAFILNKCNI